jgi:hypothetical protein
MVVFCGRIRDLFWQRPQTRKVRLLAPRGGAVQVLQQTATACLLLLSSDGALLSYEQRSSQPATPLQQAHSHPPVCGLCFTDTHGTALGTRRAMLTCRTSARTFTTAECTGASM